jgi:hypothetical protein
MGLRGSENGEQLNCSGSRRSGCAGPQYKTKGSREAALLISPAVFRR